eukprot:CAMPEP_0168620204 /NCGR_PEP_ID=MMETSP0449_2-20121227/7008_1 /TAXON_ID=1082188 /ORGANISM="Strombidium rassoulzadegani, Strain ras09" /LENGTH=110 /DNA_ID=CAMNT_0008661185 /DNA_START=75 /DNA_END=407 /DNA_ORIENTATION=+
MAALSLAASPAAATARRAVAGRPVVGKARVAAKANRAMVVRASADKREQALAAATVTAGAIMTQAAPAEAALPPSLKNLLLSVVAGGVVLGAIFTAVSAVAQFDQVSRGK